MSGSFLVALLALPAIALLHYRFPRHQNRLLLLTSLLSAGLVFGPASVGLIAFALIVLAWPTTSNPAIPIALGAGLLAGKAFGCFPGQAEALSVFSYTVLGLGLFALVQDRRAGELRRLPLSDQLLYLFYFPKLLCGPFELPTVFLPQLSAPRRLSRLQLEQSLVTIARGLIKSFVLSTRLAALAEPLFRATYPSVTTVALSAVLLTARLYYDFSGYSDLACGISGLFGITIGPNFDAPFRAASAREFWNRWHISLTRYLEAYVFLPLVKAGLPLALSVAGVFLVSALLHDVSVNFLLWGAWHFFVYRWTDPQRSGFPRGRWGWPVTLASVCFGSLLFFSPDPGHTLHTLRGLLVLVDPRGLPDTSSLSRAMLICLSLVLVFETTSAWLRAPRRQNAFFALPDGLRWAGYSLLLSLTLLWWFSDVDGSGFVYQRY